MILVTGGAGFIGSNLHAALYEAGRDVIVCDRLGSDGKWRNLQHHPPLTVIAPENLLAFLEGNPPVETVVHLGAISATTAVDGDEVWRENVALSQSLWHWCADNLARFIYASSAATYGDGAQGFEDECSTSALRRLRPLNLYGWSKHAFDLWVARQVESGLRTPPAWAGVKFFNVYGPNEYHKNGMISVVKVKFDELAAGGPARLFRSHQAGVADGAQQRDFVWVGDTVDVMLWLLDRPDVSGLFNVGTGVARSYLDMAHAVAHACGRPAEVEFVDMPDGLRGQYQSFTQARMERLRAAGYDKKFTSLEEGVGRYVRDYLTQPNAYR
jgi:ADP-L-glycero-D-manno-heptose 6-epimerase